MDQRRHHDVGQSLHHASSGFLRSEHDPDHAPNHDRGRTPGLIISDASKKTLIHGTVSDKNGRAPLPTDLCALLRDVETATIGHTEHLGFLSTSLRPVCSAKVTGKPLPSRLRAATAL